MTQNWISIVESNWIFSKFCILIYIYIYYHYFKILVNFFFMQTRFGSIFFIFSDIKILLIEFIEIHNLLAQKVGFIGSTPYKIGQKSDKKLTLLIQNYFLMSTLPVKTTLKIFTTFCLQIISLPTNNNHLKNQKLKKRTVTVPFIERLKSLEEKNKRYGL